MEWEVFSLGPLRYEEPDTTVKLSTELTGSLRQLQVSVDHWLRVCGVCWCQPLSCLTAA